MCLTFIAFMYYRYFSNKLEFKLWDMRTVTLDDFSVEIKVREPLWEGFQTIARSGTA
jgi:hypothetical protein